MTDAVLNASSLMIFCYGYFRKGEVSKLPYQVNAILSQNSSQSGKIGARPCPRNRRNELKFLLFFYMVILLLVLAIIASHCHISQEYPTNTNSVGILGVEKLVLKTF